MKNWIEKVQYIKKRICEGKHNIILGCGNDKFEGCIGVDLSLRVKPDVLCDLNKYPYPFKDSVFDNILCFSILEHLDNLVQTMNEIYRISKPKGRIYILVPHFSDSASFKDPSHRRFFSIQTFDYFVEGTELYKDFGYYSNAKFKLIERLVMLAPLFNYFRLLRWLVNRYPTIYENYLCFLIRGRGIYLELEALK